MNIQLIQGQFSSKDAIDLITKMIHVKIQFHENAINNLDNEEDVKMRERRVKQLQKNLFDARKYIEQKEGKNIAIDVEIKI